MKLSHGQIRALLCVALSEKTGTTEGSIVEIYDDFCIYRMWDNEKYFQVSYSIVDNKVTLGEPVEVVQQIDYVKVQAAFRIVAAADAEGAADDERGYAWHVQIIEAGPDRQTGLDYTMDALRAAMPLYEGARVFALTQGQHAAPQNPFGKSVREIVGWLSDVTENDTGLAGKVNILKAAKWLRDTLVDTFERDKKDLIGLSHDVLGQVVAARNGKKRVDKIVKVDSVDVVYDPIAGGKFLRMAAANQAGHEEAEMKEQLLAALKAARPDLYKQIETKVADGTVTDDEIARLFAAAITPANNVDERLTAALQTAFAGDGQAQQLLEQTRIAACEITLKDELRESGLSDLSAARVRKAFEGKVFETEQLRATINEEKEYVDKITGSGAVSGAGHVRVGNEEPEKLQAAMDKLFGVETDARFQDVQPMQSLRAAYVHLTGDQNVSGQPTPEGIKLGRAIMESMRLPAAYASTSFTYVLGNTMRRRMVQDYRALNYMEDVLISNVRNAQDFRTMESILVGYFGDLEDVDPETADYQEIDMVTDMEISYAINQKGAIFTVSRKTVLNDDLRSVQILVQRIGRAARRTKAQRSWNKIITNPAWDGDGKAIFHSDHGNLGAVAFTNDATGVTTLYNRLVAMYNQTEQDSGKKIGLRPKYIWGPIEIEALMYGMNAPWPGVAGGNPHAGRFGQNNERIITLPLTTDTNDWGLIADKNDCELLEIAYLNGQQEPEMFVADNPLVGQMFLADKIQYKVRHEYEVDAVDYRGFDKSVI
jgi:hypothetical protein